MKKIERRAIGITASEIELRTDNTGRRMAGYAALYGTRSQNLGGFTEIIKPGAFRSILATQPDVVLNFNHSQDYILGRTKAGTLTLAEDERGLRFEADLPDTQLVRDMVISPMQRGELEGTSFAFRAAQSGQEWSVEGDGMRLRSITAFDLLQDVSIVTFPAYIGPAASIRSASEVLAEAMELEERKQQILSDLQPPPAETPVDWEGQIAVRRKQLDLTGRR